MAEAAAAPKLKKSVTDWSKSTLLRNLRLINMCNGILLILAGIVCCIVAAVNVSISTITLACFTCFFGTLMACLECNIGNFAPKLKKNFGFMTSFVGRCFFIFFCGTLCLAFALWPGYLFGSITMANALFNGYIICAHPSFRSGELSMTGDPFGGYTGGEAEMLSYIKSNPQLASQASAAAVKIAKSNPELAVQVAAGVANGSSAGGGTGASTASNMTWGSA